MTNAAAAPVKKFVKAKKVAVNPYHLTYAVMIATAIMAHMDCVGPSRQAIFKYVLANYKVADAVKAQVRYKIDIRKMLAVKTISRYNVTS